MRWTKLLPVVVLAAVAFGGSFECRGSSNHDDKNHND